MEIRTMSFIMRFINLLKRKKKHAIELEQTFYGFLCTLINDNDIQEIKKSGFGSKLLNEPDLFDGKYETLLTHCILVFGIVEAFPKFKKRLLHHTDMRSFFDDFFSNSDKHLFNETLMELMLKWDQIKSLRSEMSEGKIKKTILSYMRCASKYPKLIDGYLMTHWFSEISWNMDPHTDIQESISNSCDDDASRNQAITRYTSICDFVDKHSKTGIDKKSLDCFVTFEEFHKQFFDAVISNKNHRQTFLKTNPFFVSIFIQQTGDEDFKTKFK